MNRTSGLAVILLSMLSIPFLSFLGAPAGPPPAKDVPRAETIATGLDYFLYQREGIIAHALKLDLKARDLHLRSIKARGKETVLQLMERMNDAETLVLGGINGDYFRQESSQGIPYGVQVSDGRLIFAPMKRTMIGFGPKNEPYIGVVSLKAKIAFGPKAKRPPLARWADLDAVNSLEEAAGGGSGIQLYTPDFHHLSPRRAGGKIVVIEAIAPRLQVGDVCEGRIARVVPSEERVEVPEGGCLLYLLGGTARQVESELQAGQEIALKLELPPIIGGVSQAIGGGPRLIRDGQPRSELNKESFESIYAMEISKRHPRSAVGYDRAQKYLYLVMVEGRHERSRGMTFGELGTFLAELGCYQAMAFDGGGSAGMYVAGKGFVSRSMGGFGQPEERAVANGLLITTPKKPLKK